MTEERVGASGKIGACIVPAFAAFDDEFVPGDPAAPGLVAVGHETGDPIARALWGDGKGVGSRQRPILRPGS